MSSDPEVSEPSYPEMLEILFKENPAIEGKRRRRAILALAVGLLAVPMLREAWDHGIVAQIAEHIWNILCTFATDWRDFLIEAFHALRQPSPPVR